MILNFRGLDSERNVDALADATTVHHIIISLRGFISVLHVLCIELGFIFFALQNWQKCLNDLLQ